METMHAIFDDFLASVAQHGLLVRVAAPVAAAAGSAGVPQPRPAPPQLAGSQQQRWGSLQEAGQRGGPEDAASRDTLPGGKGHGGEAQKQAAGSSAGLGSSDPPSSDPPSSTRGPPSSSPGSPPSSFEFRQQRQPEQAATRMQLQRGATGAASVPAPGAARATSEQRGAGAAVWPGGFGSPLKLGQPQQRASPAKAPPRTQMFGTLPSAQQLSGTPPAASGGGGAGTSPLDAYSSARALSGSTPSPAPTTSSGANGSAFYTARSERPAASKGRDLDSVIASIWGIGAEARLRQARGAS